MGADISDELGPEREEAPVPVERELGARYLIARLVVRHERLGTVAGPLDRPPHALRRPAAEDELGIEHVARSEPAADVPGNDAHAVRRHAEHAREHALVPVHPLPAGKQRQPAVFLVPDPDRGPRLHLAVDDPVVEEGAADDMRRARERLVGGRGIAELRIERQVPGTAVPDLRRVRQDRLPRVSDRRQRIIGRFDEVGGIAARLAALGNDDGDDLADMPDPVPDDRRLRGVERLAAIEIGESRSVPVDGAPRVGSVGDAAETVVGVVRARQDGGHARRPQRPADIDAEKAGMGVRTSHHDCEVFALERDIVRIGSAARQQARILAAPDRGADARAFRPSRHPAPVLSAGRHRRGRRRGSTEHSSRCSS